MDDTGRQFPTLSELVDEHYAVLYRYAFRLCGEAANAEDLTQQTFLIAQRKLDQLREPPAARGWLCTILRNCYLRQLRDGKPHVALEEIGEPAAVDGESDWDVDTEALQAALNDLPERYRTPLVLYYFHELSYREIGEIVQAPPGTVMSRLSRGKDFLRRKLSRSTVVSGHDDSTPLEP